MPMYCCHIDLNINTFILPLLLYNITIADLCKSVNLENVHHLLYLCFLSVRHSTMKTNVRNYTCILHCRHLFDVFG